GEVKAAVENLEHAVDLPDLTPAVALDPGIIAAEQAAFGHCLLGHPARGRDLAHAAISRAQAARHAPPFVQAVIGGVQVGVITREDEGLAQSAALVASIPEPLQSQWRPWAEIAQGWLEVGRGDSRGLERILDGRDALVRARTPYFQSLYGLILSTNLVS